MLAIRALIYILLPILCKPDYIDSVHDTLCSRFWFAYSLIVPLLFWHLILTTKLHLTIILPFVWVCLHDLIIWLSTSPLGINVNDSVMVVWRNQKRTRDIQVSNVYSEGYVKSQRNQINTAEHAAKNRRTEMGRNNHAIKVSNKGKAKS